VLTGFFSVETIPEFKVGYFWFLAGTAVLGTVETVVMVLWAWPGFLVTRFDRDTLGALGVRRMARFLKHRPPQELTVGDIVRPDLQGTLPTPTDVESWKSAFTGFGLTWPEHDALQTERPGGMLTFDDDYDGYLSGTADSEGVELTAVIGFEEESVAWFTCYAFGPQTTTAESFMRTCWEAAAVVGADQEAGATWIDSTLATESDEPNQIFVDIEPVCPAVLMVTAMNPMSGFINTQLTIAAGQNC
jgi:hypothetical protein